MNKGNVTIVLVFMGFFLFLLLLEALFPLRHRTRALVRRLVTNLCVSAFAFAVAAGIVRPVGLSLADWTSARPFGLLHIVALPAAVQLGLAFLLMDLTFYYWHLANHVIPGLWRFHNVHHIDPDLDVSTALRFHVGEVLLSTGFRVIQVGLIGLSPLMYMIYESVFQGSTLFQHSNGLDIPQSALVIGIPAYHEPVDNTLWNVLVLPFRTQRVYWCWPDGSQPTRDTTETRARRSQMME